MKTSNEAREPGNQLPLFYYRQNCPTLSGKREIRTPVVAKQGGIWRMIFVGWAAHSNAAKGKIIYRVHFVVSPHGRIE